MTEHEVYEITETEGFNSVEQRFDRAEEREIFFGDEKELAPDHKGIYNTRTRTLAQVSSKYYQIIQHNDVIKALGEVLKARGITIQGRADNFGNQMRMDLVFTNQGVPIKDDATGIKLGIRVLNSYNKATSFRLELFGFRMICQNGMSLGKVLNEIKEVTFHMGKEKTYDCLIKIVNTFIDKAIAGSETLQNYVNKSIVDSINWEEVAKLMKTLFIHKKHRDAICDKLGISIIEIKDKVTKTKSYEFILDNPERTQITRWQIYNAITEYTSHIPLGISVENRLQEVAQKVLGKSFKELIVVEKQ